MKNGKLRLTNIFRLILASSLLGLVLSCGNISAKEYPRRTAVVEAFEQVSPTVVNISTERIYRQRPFRIGPFWSPLDELYGREYRTESLGSGLIVSPDGYVVTNAHVVSQASRVVVALLDGSEYEADLIGTDQRNDIAILKIHVPEGEEKVFSYLPFGRSDDLMIGETVLAIGNPQGFGHTITQGVISALERKIVIANREFPGLIQTDAAINPGNSGGPLININGELIGINMAMANAENIGFAVPTQRVERIFDQYIKGIISLVDSIGLEIDNVPPRIAKYLKLESTDGVLITTIVEGGYGDQMGLQAGDVILTINEKRVTDRSDYNRRLTELPEGAELRLEIFRKGEILQPKIKTKSGNTITLADLSKPWFGIVAEPIDSAKAKTFGVKVDNGVLITSVEENSPADEVGLKQGDVITSVGRKKIASIGDYRQARALLQGFVEVELLVQRQGRQYRVSLTKQAEE
jgi:serine protease Do